MRVRALHGHHGAREAGRLCTGRGACPQSRENQIPSRCGLTLSPKGAAGGPRVNSKDYFLNMFSSLIILQVAFQSLLAPTPRGGVSAWPRLRAPGLLSLTCGSNEQDELTNKIRPEARKHYLLRFISLIFLFFIVKCYNMWPSLHPKGRTFLCL